MNMLKEKINWTGVFDMFRSHDPLRPALCEIRLVGNSVFATDAHVIVKVDSSLVPDQFYTINSIHQYPDCQSVIDRHSFPTDELMVSPDDILQKLSSLQTENVYANCKECGGVGEVECGCCGNYGECDECYGDGHTGEVIGQTISRDKYQLNMFGVHFDVNYISNAMKAFKSIGIESANIGVSTKKKSAVITGEGILILMMGLSWEPKEEIEIITIN